ncbi:DUF6382 domain-containing protein [Cohnella yongneupensis]|uniref:DUF6382 domain-containing protein n=1 Tax=Cohnella yongneupensis TaxID=425006 RepID=A0ABW0R3L5_9BACL
MTIKEESGFDRSSINWTQLQMLKRCEVPGLLPIEMEELDGIIKFKYDLGGYRMLGEALRIAKWTMTDLMNALGRLSEVLEDCRLYLLEADRIMLADDFIYVGGDWQNMQFTYLPLNKAVNGNEDALERLVVRWMMKVDDLDGRAMQQVLGIVGAPGFVPHALRSFVRQYLSAGRGDNVRYSPPLSAMLNERIAAAPVSMVGSAKDEPEVPERAAKARGLSWRLLQPPSGDPHTLSEMLGDEQPTWHDAAVKLSANKPREPGASVRPAMDPHRRRTLTGAAATLVVAMAWWFGYMASPGKPAMLACLGLTILAVACVLSLWSGMPKWLGLRSQAKPAQSKTRRSEAALDERNNDVKGMLDWEDVDEEADIRPRRFQIQVSDNGEGRSVPASANASARQEIWPREMPAETTWLRADQEDRTEMLGRPHNDAKPSCYLIWESKGEGSRINLSDESLVIGRSAEAAKHVDETFGVSRAHAEVIRSSAQWKVKDLGSRNGSRLNDVPMTPYELYPLEPGDCLALAGSKYRFVQEGL